MINIHYYWSCIFCVIYIWINTCWRFENILTITCHLIKVKKNTDCWYKKTYHVIIYKGFYSPMVTSVPCPNLVPCLHSDTSRYKNICAEDRSSCSSHCQVSIHQDVEIHEKMKQRTSFDIELLPNAIPFYTRWHSVTCAHLISIIFQSEAVGFLYEQSTELHHCVIHWCHSHQHKHRYTLPHPQPWFHWCVDTQCSQILVQNMWTC